MKDYYITVTGMNHYYGLAPFSVGKVLKCYKEPSNPYDNEAIVVKLKEVGNISDLRSYKNYDKHPIHLPRQGKWTTCNSGINGAKWGNKSDDSAMELPADYF